MQIKKKVKGFNVDITKIVNDKDTDFAAIFFINGFVYAGNSHSWYRANLSIFGFSDEDKKILDKKFISTKQFKLLLKEDILEVKQNSFYAPNAEFSVDLKPIELEYLQSKGMFHTIKILERATFLDEKFFNLSRRIAENTPVFALNPKILNTALSVLQSRNTVVFNVFKKNTGIILHTSKLKKEYQSSEYANINGVQDEAVLIMPIVLDK